MIWVDGLDVSRRGLLLCCIVSLLLFFTNNFLNTQLLYHLNKKKKKSLPAWRKDAINKCHIKSSWVDLIKSQNKIVWHKAPAWGCNIFNTEVFLSYSAYCFQQRSWTSTIILQQSFHFCTKWQKQSFH